MRQFILIILTAVFALSLSGCAYDHYSYPNGYDNHSVTASGDCPAKADQNALKAAKNTCKKEQKVMKVINMRRVQNGITSLFKEFRGTYCESPHRRDKDYYTIVNFVCIKAPPCNHCQKPVKTCPHKKYTAPKHHKK